jgi:hypothetical protein
MSLKELAKEIELIKNNHLAHMAEDIDKLDRKVDKMDGRLWWILAILVGATLLPIITDLIKTIR